MNPNKLVPELTVLDFEKAIQFYIEILGFRISYERDGPRFVYLEYESAQIMIEESHAGAWKTAELSPPLGRGVNFQIEVSDVNLILDKLAKAKYSLYREPRDVWYQSAAGVEGQREFLVQDPDGYLLRFTQYLGTRAKAA